MRCGIEIEELVKLFRSFGERKTPIHPLLLQLSFSVSSQKRKRIIMPHHHACRNAFDIPVPDQSRLKQGGQAGEEGGPRMIVDGLLRVSSPVIWRHPRDVNAFSPVCACGCISLPNCSSWSNSVLKHLSDF